MNKLHKENIVIINKKPEMKNFRLIEARKNGGRFIDHHKKIKKFTHFT